MRSSFALSGLLLGAFFSTAVYAQDGDTTTNTDYEVISAPALSSDEIRSEVLIEIASNGQQLVAVGAHGNVIRQDSDGNWVQADVDSSVLITSVDFANAEKGWATGHHGVILTTEDGGQSWTRQLDGFQLMELEKAFYQKKVSALQAQIEKEEDPEVIGELEWQLEEAQFQISNIEVAEEEGPSKPFLDILALNEQTAFAIGAYGTFLKTTDGGANWQVISDKLENPGGYHLNAIIARGNDFFIVGEAGLLFSSDDKGENWTRLESPYRGSLFGAHLDNADNLWIYGLRGNAYVSSDKGQSFEQVETGTGVNLSAGVSTESGDQLIVGHSGTILKVDAELNVEALRHPSGSVMTDIVVVNDGEWLMTGRSGLLHWPAKVTEDEALASQQGAQ
jgi:photosystem II stability/assembly factor-like uncharacterized protein